MWDAIVLAFKGILAFCGFDKWMQTRENVHEGEVIQKDADLTAQNELLRKQERVTYPKGNPFDDLNF